MKIIFTMNQFQMISEFIFMKKILKKIILLF